MYTRDSDARTIADDIMAEGSARGDTLIECNYKQQMYMYLAEHGTASTLGGWLSTVEDHPHRPSHITMGFIIAHRYLREEFPQDVLDEMARFVLREEDGAKVMAYILGGTGWLPQDVEDDLPVCTPEDIAAFDAIPDMVELVGDV